MKLKHVLWIIDSFCVLQFAMIALLSLKDDFQRFDIWVLFLSLTFGVLCASYFRTMFQLMQVRCDSQKLDAELNDLFQKAKRPDDISKP